MRQQAGNERRRKEAESVWMKRKTEVEWLYLGLEWPQLKVAEYFGVSLRAVQDGMDRLGIQPRPRATKGKRNGRYKDGTQSRQYRTVITMDKCRKCEATESLGVHHKNDDRFDNRLENLEVLCDSCHMSETKRKWRKATLS